MLTFLWIRKFCGIVWLLSAQVSSLLLLLCLFNEVKDDEWVLVSSALLCVQISIRWQPYTAICLQVVSMLARQGFCWLAVCFLFQLAVWFLVCLALEDQSGLTSGFKSKCIPSLSSDLGTDTLECRSDFCETLISVILEDILPFETIGFAVWLLLWSLNFYTRHILLTFCSLEVYVSNPILDLDVQSVWGAY